MRRNLQFEAMQVEDQEASWKCAELLKAMELDEEENIEEVMDSKDLQLTKDDIELSSLPNEWIFDLAEHKKKLLEGGLIQAHHDLDNKKDTEGAALTLEQSILIAGESKDVTTPSPFQRSQRNKTWRVVRRERKKKRNNSEGP